MPAPGKQSPSSPATDRPPAASALTRAEALRWWRAGYQAGHQAAEREQQAAARQEQLAAACRARQAATRKATIDALLLETIDVLARLLTSHDNGKG
jgi:hypothetical protein